MTLPALLLLVAWALVVVIVGLLYIRRPSKAVHRVVQAFGAIAFGAGVAALWLEVRS